MMSSENMASDLSVQEETQAAGDQKVLPEHVMKCPRCGSSNTKFCYYNNYSLSQPRHFCKTCRRYWTKGGTLRNVPVGGGCRKSKKEKTPGRAGEGDAKGINLSAGIAGLKLLNGLSPAMDFQLGGLYSHLPLGSSSTSAMGLNYPLLTGLYSRRFGSAFPAMNSDSLNLQTILASSIESLSSINQDLHWKLQQQRLCGRLSTDQKLHPIYFQNLDLSEPAQIETSGNGRKERDPQTDRLFLTSYAAPNVGGAAASGSWDGIQTWNNHLSSSYGRLPSMSCSKKERK